MPKPSNSMRRRRSGRNHSTQTVVLACAIALSPVFATSQNPTNPAVKADDTQIVKDFQTRVSHYLEERRKQAGTSPRPTTSPEKLQRAQEDLSHKSKISRADAERGDIFTPEISRYFRRQLAATLAGPQGVKVRASLRHAEPVDEASLHVNQVYPGRLPLQSMPPSLLLNLPRLPKDLQYRIVGRNLVLLDTASKLIVDFVPGATPPIKD